jgi:hypothetical protein
MVYVHEGTKCNAVPVFWPLILKCPEHERHRYAAAIVM